MPFRLRALVFLLPALSAAAALVVLDASLVWGRAGGGGSYGGGGGGGGGGGDDLSGWVIYILIQLIFDYPLVGVPLLVVAIACAAYAGHSTRSGYVSRTIRRGEALQVRSERERFLALLKFRDPQFDEGEFLGRVSRVFVRIQEAWSSQDLSAVRPFISDGIRERFSLQIKMQQALGYRNPLDNLVVRGATTAAIASDAQFDTIHVEFRATADDYRVDLATGRWLGGERTTGEFIEYWSFHRRPGAKTLAHPGSLEGHCPNCGAPLEIVDEARCASCQSTVNSGEHDWVLAEITQAQEWRVPEDDARVPGLAELKAADPAFSAQHIEDRVSVMFWRLRAAEFFGDIGYATPVASARFVSQFAADVAGPARHFSQDAAVGKVELLEFGCHADLDRLKVAVRWSGVLCEGDPRGSHREIRSKAIRTQVFELVRKPGVSSQASAAFSSASCSQCGAPIAVTSEARCTFCGANLNDGKYDWVLDAVARWSPQFVSSVSGGTPAAPSRAGAARNGLQPARPAQAELSLAVLARMVAADGQIDPREQEAFVKLGARRGLSPEQVDVVMNTATAGEIDLPVPSDPREAGDYLQQMVAMNLADGNISAQERQLLTVFARRLNLSPADVRLEIARQRKARFQAAKNIIKQSKRGSA